MWWEQAQADWHGHDPARSRLLCCATSRREGGERRADKAPRPRGEATLSCTCSGTQERGRPWMRERRSMSSRYLHDTRTPSPKDPRATTHGRTDGCRDRAAGGQGWCIRRPDRVLRACAAAPASDPIRSLTDAHRHGPCDADPAIARRWCCAAWCKGPMRRAMASRAGARARSRAPGAPRGSGCPAWAGTGNGAHRPMAPAHRCRCLPRCEPLRRSARVSPERSGGADRRPPVPGGRRRPGGVPDARPRRAHGCRERAPRRRSPPPIRTARG